jgi:hypothetical protein
VSSATGVFFSYLIGLVFTVGGLVFLVGLDDNRYLYGVPYLAMGLLIIGGVHASQRRARRRAAEQAARGAEGGEPPQA